LSAAAAAEAEAAATMLSLAAPRETCRAASPPPALRLVEADAPRSPATESTSPVVRELCRPPPAALGEPHLAGLGGVLLVATAPSAEEGLIRQWLEGMGLGGYADVLVREGWDSIQVPPPPLHPQPLLPPS
jgi:hypothetical protein